MLDYSQIIVLNLGVNCVPYLYICNVHRDIELDRSAGVVASIVRIYNHHLSKSRSFIPRKHKESINCHIPSITLLIGTTSLPFPVHSGACTKISGRLCSTYQKPLREHYISFLNVFCVYYIKFICV